MRSTHLLSSLLLIFSLLPLRSLAAPLAPERLLDKLSLQLRGRFATPSEKQEFKAELQHDPEHFLDLYGSWIDRWLEDPAYAKQIAQLHKVWWRVPAETTAQLAGDVVAQNRPYSEIYVRDYLYADATTSSAYQALGAKTLADLPFDSPEPVYVPLAPEETRFRGFFASLEFLSTYPDTDTNKNRKRSSQVFRIGFCETLQNVGAKAFTPALSELPPDPHGTNPDCIGCHRRLDPMARFFDRWRPALMMGGLPAFDQEQAAQGQVHVGGPLGMDRGLPGVTDAALGAIVVKQPEFAGCVAKLAWQYAFGSSVAMQQADLNDLTQLYQGTERMNPLVKKVLLHPYFWSDAEIPPLRFEDIKPALKNCGSCHANARGTRFDPEHYPFRADPAANVSLLKRIWKSVNRYPGVRPMPELPQPRLPIETLDALRSWISRGAELEAGHPTLTPEDVEAILE